MTPPAATSYSYEIVQGISHWLLERTDIRPTIGAICGTGMSSLAEMLTHTTSFNYEDIPKFPRSTVPGHAGKLIFGRLKTAQVVCMQGRFHFYEGYPLTTCTMPVRLMKLCGVNHLIVSNAAGGINREYNEGDIMLLKDHLNLMSFAGNNPLVGPNDERWGPRFLDTSCVYDRGLIEEAKRLAKNMEMDHLLREGVYAYLGGPSFETIAEINMLRSCGADAVGMSTVGEALVARHTGITVFAFSLVTNKCSSDYDQRIETNHEEVLEVGKKRSEIIKKWIASLIEHIHERSGV